MSRWDDVRPYFETTAVAHFATLMPDGSPHSVPVWVGVEGDRLAVFSIAGHRKDRNIRADPRVALSVTRPEHPLASAFVRGRVVARLEGTEALQIVDRIAQLYTGEAYALREGLVAYLIQPETWWSRDYAGE
jgi:PPOX class probable F420-dependent enzyme